MEWITEDLTGHPFIEEENRMLTFLCYREIATDEERAVFLNEWTKLLPREVGRRHWNRSMIVDWKAHHKPAVFQDIAKFFMPHQQRAESMIFKKGMFSFTRTDATKILWFISQYVNTLPRIVDRIWKEGHPTDKNWALSKEFTRDDIEQAVYALVRGGISARWNIHDARTWPRKWMLKIVEIWNSVDDAYPSHEAMKPKTVEFLRRELGDKRKDDEFLDIDMSGAVVQAIQWGFIAGATSQGMLRIHPAIEPTSRSDEAHMEDKREMQTAQFPREYEPPAQD